MRSGTIDVVIRADREGDRARLVPAGSFDLSHAAAVRQAAKSIEAASLDAAQSTST
jgi:hypothetical protein